RLRSLSRRDGVVCCREHGALQVTSSMFAEITRSQAPSVGCLLFDEDFDLHDTGFLELEREIKAIIWEEGLHQTTQYDMHATWYKSDFAKTGDRQIFHVFALCVHNQCGVR